MKVLLKTIKHEHKRIMAVQHREPCPFGNTKQDLSKHHFSSAEKLWFAQEISKKKNCARKWAKKFNLSANRLYKWANIFKRGLIPREAGGRVPRLTSEDERAYEIAVTNQDYQMDVAAATDMLQDLGKTTDSQRRGVTRLQAKKLSKSTIRRVNKRLELTTGNAETTPNARVEAESDIRHTVSFAACNHLMVKLVNPNLIVNMGATQFKVGNSGDDLVKVVVRRKNLRSAQGGKIKLKTKSRKGKTGIVAYYIKYYLVMSAGGYSSKPVFVIQDENMEADAMDAYEVPGLGISGHFGWIVFCKKRAGNSKFFEWMNESVVFKLISEIRADCKLPVDSLAFLTLDGENIQIKPYSEKRLIEKLEANRIVVAKSPASATATMQPADVGNCFIAGKTVAKHLDGRDYKDPALEDSIKKVITRHDKDFNASHRSLLIDGLQKVRTALTIAITHHNVTESFKKSGTYDSETGSYSLERIIANCKAEITPDLLLTIVNAIPTLAKLTERQGELFDRDFNHFHVPGSNKDSLILPRRRMVILTSPKVIQSEVEMTKEKEVATSRALLKKRSKAASSSSAQETTNAKKRKKKIDTAPLNALSTLSNISSLASINHLSSSSSAAEHSRISASGRPLKKPRYLD